MTQLISQQLGWLPGSCFNRKSQGLHNASLSFRVPSNCQRAFILLAFDPDGDVVRCRYGNSSLSECNSCNPPSVLSLSPVSSQSQKTLILEDDTIIIRKYFNTWQKRLYFDLMPPFVRLQSCTLTFSPTNSSNQGSYAVQLVMEDFPRNTVTLTQTGGSQTNVATNNAISKLPVQFALKGKSSCLGTLDFFSCAEVRNDRRSWLIDWVICFLVHFMATQWHGYP